ncbi:NUDIX hydrolase [Vibrio sp. SM6]|uniref:GDP-mannose pyrophosphatase n=1 Tax=Vibrio agarilyticus TaxID=2726741 RepID=A0A7X8YG34_9VIBR|nr:NUDIX hydrolase [Vibrio agarilyticus]NLS12160.1 NUDIX hydrolase [Vibrio agarilyticus]
MSKTNTTKIIHSWNGVSLEQECVTLPNDAQIQLTKLHHPGAAIILPLTENGDVILLNQYRPALKRWLWELPAGTLEPGETPLACAARELEEETGYSAAEFHSLGYITPLAGLCDSIQHLFVAKALTLSQRFHRDDDEIIEVLQCRIGAIEQAIIDGHLIDAKTIACLSKAKLCGFLS